MMTLTHPTAGFTSTVQFGLCKNGCCGGPRGCCDSCFSIDDDDDDEPAPKGGRKKQLGAHGGNAGVQDSSAVSNAAAELTVTAQPAATPSMSTTQTPVGDNQQAPATVEQTHKGEYTATGTGTTTANAAPTGTNPNS
jgi:hypothetical protein